MLRTSLSHKVPIGSIPTLAPRDLLAHYQALIGQGHRLLTFYASPSCEPSDFTLTLILINGERALTVLRCPISKHEAFPSFLPENPSFHIFEREIFEQTGITPQGNPWLKPVRFPVNASMPLEAYPFFTIAGKEVHEVGVGPVHAGVIEPGHFRFMCYGETVHHLEIQLGYQHRGIDALIRQRDPRRLATIMESVAGDSCIAHVSAYSLALEALSEHKLAPTTPLLRALALELERMAMHLVGLTGLASDIAYLPGASTYGRLRTAVINLSMRLSGSRFGRCWVRPGGIRYGIDRKQAHDVTTTLTKMRRDLETINDCMFTARTVRHRLKGVGQLSSQLARDIGLVGMIARSCGLSIDLGQKLPAEVQSQMALAESQGGDCWARALIRKEEIDQSLTWILETLQGKQDMPAEGKPLASFAPNSLVIAGVEGWRGEVVHCLETDKQGKICHYRLQDPSLRNWFGLAQAVRGNAISDFPICNKSFDLSYCGHDL